MTNMKAEIDSPLALQSKAQLFKTIAVKEIINAYQNQFKIDVSDYFKNLTDIGVYQCEKTGYGFYYPFHIDGKSSFYKQLQTFEWYYMPWKWEHSKTKELLQGNERILEVGSGDFGFVERLNGEGFTISGLELNEDSIEKAKQLGLKAFDERIQEHAQANPCTYDVICSFQVLEHIHDVRSFIQAQIESLKKGGKLIIAVPNNNSFIKFSNGGILNLPPHHMGLWNETALKGLADAFDLKIEHILYEPLQDYHVNWYIDTFIASKIRPYKNLHKLFKVLKIKRLLRLYVKWNQKRIKGHSMLAVYKKVS